MPLYECRCDDCDRVQDYVQTVARHAESPACRDCGSPTHQIVTPAHIQADLPEYESPVSGKIIRGRRMRRYDLESNNCRPYEGLEAERKESQSIRSQRQRQINRKVDAELERTITELDVSNRLERTDERSDRPYEDAEQVRTY